MSENQNQGCIKCGHTEIEEGTLSATGSGLSKFLDVQHNKQDRNRSRDFIDLFFGG